MSRDLINRKTLRKIRGMINGEIKEIVKKYFLSLSFFYMISFAFLHYILDKDSIFLTTFGVVIFDMVASCIYYTLYILQYRWDKLNIAHENKKIEKPYKIPLIDKNNGEAETISAFKMILFFICAMFLSVYYFFFGYVLHDVKFMSISNSFEFSMFFMSVAYFDLFFEGGFGKLRFNLRRIKFLTRDDILIKKLGFYLLLLSVAIYQIYAYGTDIILLVSII